VGISRKVFKAFAKLMNLARFSQTLQLTPEAPCEVSPP
jgi:hypothetical protein